MDSCSLASCKTERTIMRCFLCPAPDSGRMIGEVIRGRDKGRERGRRGGHAYVQRNAVRRGASQYNSVQAASPRGQNITLACTLFRAHAKS
eukprot:3421100-Pyramimonas_sp.AAC.1